MLRRLLTTALLAGAACAHVAPESRAAAADDALQAAAVRGVADFYGVSNQRELLFCVATCEGERCHAPSAQFVARFEHDQFRVNDPRYCMWRDGRVMVSGRASSELGLTRLDLRTPPRGALYLDLSPAVEQAGKATVNALMTVGKASTRGLKVELEQAAEGEWRVVSVGETGGHALGNNGT